jgi:hypothetical protein
MDIAFPKAFQHVTGVTVESASMEHSNKYMQLKALNHNSWCNQSYIKYKQIQNKHAVTEHHS